jgi:hypothetical protein
MIGGVNWNLILDKNTNAGEFLWGTHTIKIKNDLSDERKFNVLIHEIIEVIMTNNMMRFQKCVDNPNNGDYLFCFDHDKFEVFTDELSGILKNINMGGLK